MSYSKSTSPALAALVKFLTRPLLSTYPATTVMALQLSLEATLSHLFTTPANPGFIFALTPTSAPAAIYAASTTSGVAWGEWIKALGGADLHFVISDKSVRVSIADKFEDKFSVTLWSTEKPVEESDDSDTDSVSSSMFSFGHSDDEESLTSVSSTSSPVVKACELPAVSKPTRSFLRAPAACTPRYQPPARRAPKPAPKAEVTNYLYEGGATSVVGGGVLLGAGAGAPATQAFVSKAQRPSPPPVVRSQPKPKTAADSNNWRRV